MGLQRCRPVYFITSNTKRQRLRLGQHIGHQHIVIGL